MSIAPGWYQDPAEPTTQRWWDGEGWVGDPVPADATPPPGPPPAAPAETAPPLPGEQPTSAEPTSAEPAGRKLGGGKLSTGKQPAGRRLGGGKLAAGKLAGGKQQQQPAQPAPDPAGAPPGSYRAPGAPGAPTRAAPHGFPLATLGARLVARLVDIGLVLGLNVLVNGWFAYQYWTEISPAMAEIWRRGLAGESTLSDLPEVGDRAGTLQIVILILAAALWFAYEVPAVANTGQTPGKRLLGIKVIRLEDPRQAAGGAPPAEPTEPAPLGFGRSFRRWNTMGLPTLLWWCFGLGLLLQLLDAVFALFDRPLQQALHDKSAHTAVIAVTDPTTDPTTDSDSDSDSGKEAADGPADPS